MAYAVNDAGVAGPALASWDGLPSDEVIIMSSMVNNVARCVLNNGKVSGDRAVRWMILYQDPFRRNVTSFLRLCQFVRL